METRPRVEQAPCGEGARDAGNGSLPAGKALLEIDQQQLRDHVSAVVLETVEETLNAPLDAEADRRFNAARYQHSPGRKDTRAGSYGRKL